MCSQAVYDAQASGSGSEGGEKWQMADGRSHSLSVVCRRCSGCSDRGGSSAAERDHLGLRHLRVKCTNCAQFPPPRARNRLLVVHGLCSSDSTSTSQLRSQCSRSPSCSPTVRRASDLPKASRDTPSRSSYPPASGSALPSEKWALMQAPTANRTTGQRLSMSKKGRLAIHPRASSQSWRPVPCLSLLWTGCMAACTAACQLGRCQ